MHSRSARHFKPVLAALLGVGALLSTGCKDFKSIQTPETRVLSARLVDETEEGARVLVDVELTHKNSEALPLSDARYSAQIPSIADYSGSDVPNRTLPAAGRQVITLPIVYKTDEPVTGQPVVVSGSVAYQPPGEIRKLLTESGIPLPRTRFSGRVIIDEAFEQTPPPGPVSAEPQPPEPTLR